MASLLSMRGSTLCRWKFVMTAAAVSPIFAKCLNASVLDLPFGG